MYCQNNFPAHAMIARFAIFRKCRIAPFAKSLHPLPASYSRPQKPERKNSPSFHSYIALPILHTYSASALPGFISGRGVGV